MYRKVTKEELEKVTDKRPKLKKMLDEFSEMGEECVELKDHNYADAFSGAASISRAIERYEFENLECFAKEGKIYIVNHAVKRND